MTAPTGPVPDWTLMSEEEKIRLFNRTLDSWRENPAGFTRILPRLVRDNVLPAQEMFLDRARRRPVLCICMIDNMALSIPHCSYVHLWSMERPKPYLVVTIMGVG